MSIVSLTVDDGISKEFEKLIKKTRNMKPAMREVEMLVMRPLRSKAWQKSGLQSQSGELEDSVETWVGKKSAGISVHTKPGKDLVIPKAVLHTSGARRGKYTKKKRYSVRDHRRGGRRVGQYTRRNSGSPWGEIKPRPFIPARFGAGDIQQIKRIIARYLNV